MRRRLSATILVVPVIALALFPACGRSSEPAKRVPPAGPATSVLLITIDTLRADSVGCYRRGAAARTPALDRLAAAGTRFANAHAHNVVTLPSHANILSGLLPIHHGVRDNSGFRFPATANTLATWLKGRGYHTGAFVSAFPVAARFGLDRGFDVYDDEFVGSQPRTGLQEQARPGTETVERARRFIAAVPAGQPWFVWVHVYEPHFPYVNANYQDDVAAADSAVAPLIDDALARRTGGATLVVATGDHGESLGEHAEATHGILAYEATLRVPLVIAMAGAPPAVVTDAVRHVDIAPTILEAAGGEIPGGLDGRSLLPAIRGKALAAAPCYFEALSGNLGRGWAPLRGVIAGNRKYVDLPIAELYDLANDSAERTNLAGDKAAAAPLQRLLADLRRGERPARASAETAENAERLRALGYVSANGGASDRPYSAADDPKNLMLLDARLQEVAALEAEGRPHDAMVAAEQLVRMRPSMAVSHLYLAHLQREAGDLTGAKGSLRAALALRRDDANAATLLATVLAQLGDAAGALRVLQPFTAASTADQDVLLTQALVLARLGRFDEAATALTRAGGGKPPTVRVLVQEGTILLMAGRTQQARKAFRDALALRPDAARAHTSLALMDAQAGDLDAAGAHWRAALRADPSEKRSIVASAAILKHAGREREAAVALGIANSSSGEARQ